jgi:hypothetical protein
VDNKSRSKLSKLKVGVGNIQQVEGANLGQAVGQYCGIVRDKKKGSSTGKGHHAHGAQALCCSHMATEEFKQGWNDITKQCLRISSCQQTSGNRNLEEKLARSQVSYIDINYQRRQRERDVNVLELEAYRTRKENGRKSQLHSIDLSQKRSRTCYLSPKY